MFPQVDISKARSRDATHDHGAIQWSSMTTPSYRTMIPYHPHGELKPCLTMSSQNIFELVHTKEGFFLQESQIPPPVTSILRRNSTAAPSQPWTTWHGRNSERRTPWDPHHTPMSWTQPLHATYASHQWEIANSQSSLQNTLPLLEDAHQRVGSDTHSYFGDRRWERTGARPRAVCMPLPKRDQTAYQLEYSRVYLSAI